MNLTNFPTKLCSGWGRYPVSPSRVCAVQSADEAAYWFGRRGDLQVLGRGEGRAYGDAALNRDNLCLDFTPSDRFIAFDPQSGVLHAEAGATLEQILNAFVPRGWFLAVTPGTKYPTLGGCVACDVHGKSKYPLSRYVKRLHMLLADGKRLSCSASERPELFWATLGGMGLTGLILSVELQMEPITSSYLHYEGIKSNDLEGSFALFEDSTDSPLTVAWIDCLSQGRALGRSIMMRGHFARPEELPRRLRKEPLAVGSKGKIPVPVEFPTWALNPLSMKAFNLAYYTKHPRRMSAVMDYDSFFYPLDSILHWNRIYGRKGMLQYQFLIPPPASFDGVKTVLEAIAATGKASFLAVLKKFGPLDQAGPLSFPTEGYFLALDFPVGNGAILTEMDKWDELVLKYGGRIYLAKDARMRPDVFAQMYPRLAEWKAVKAVVDPRNVFASDLGRRLRLEPEPLAAGTSAAKPAARKTAPAKTKRPAAKAARPRAGRKPK